MEEKVQQKWPRKRVQGMAGRTLSKTPFESGWILKQGRLDAITVTEVKCYVRFVIGFNGIPEVPIYGKFNQKSLQTKIQHESTSSQTTKRGHSK